jgi:hypothetical protein
MKEPIETQDQMGNQEVIQHLREEVMLSQNASRLDPLHSPK